MSKQTKLLTDPDIKTAKAQEKVYYLPDGEGLRLQIKPNGTKIWVFRFMFNGKSKETTFKNYPTVSLKEAREKKEAYRKLLNDDIEPIEYYRNKKQNQKLDEDNSFSKVLDEWLENEKLKSQMEHSRKKRLFEKDVLPFFKYKTISKITIQDLVTVLKEKETSAPDIASKMYGYLKSLFSFATLRGYCKRNLLADINKSHVLNKRVTKHMAKITDTEILKELINAIYEYKGTDSVRNALKLVLHIPLRADNLCTLKWKEIDFNKKLITIPREQMKFKNPNINDFKMPLSDEVISILKDQKEYQKILTNELNYVFVGVDNRTHIHRESPNNALQIMSFNDEKKGRKIRLHGFRGTFRSMIDTLDKRGNFNFDVKERALDHHDRNISTRAYTHKADFEDQTRELMNFWSDYILSLKVK